MLYVPPYVPRLTPSKISPTSFLFPQVRGRRLYTPRLLCATTHIYTLNAFSAPPRSTQPHLQTTPSQSPSHTKVFHASLHSSWIHPVQDFTNSFLFAQVRGRRLYSTFSRRHALRNHVSKPHQVISVFHASLRGSAPPRSTPPCCTPPHLQAMQSV